MSAAFDPFGRFPLEEAIARRAGRCGIELDRARVEALTAHARAVLRENPRLHLTSLVEPEPFVERHLGESFEGAAMLDAGIAGVLVDLGSGNGYPGLAVVAARPGLRPVLVEASAKKAAFLRSLIEAGGFPGAAVLERQVQRPDDLGPYAGFAVLVTRATRAWPKVVPRLVQKEGKGPARERSSPPPRPRMLLWAGKSVEEIRHRAAWRHLRLAERRALPGRDRSWVWRFEPMGGDPRRTK